MTAPDIPELDGYDIVDMCDVYAKAKRDASHKEQAIWVAAFLRLLEGARALPYLSQHLKNWLERWGEENLVCPHCLTDLKRQQWQEARPYGATVAYETVQGDWYCPACEPEKEEG